MISLMPLPTLAILADICFHELAPLPFRHITLTAITLFIAILILQRQPLSPGCFHTVSHRGLRQPALSRDALLLRLQLMPLQEAFARLRWLRRDYAFTAGQLRLTPLPIRCDYASFCSCLAAADFQRFR